MAQIRKTKLRHPELVSGSIGRFTLPDGRQAQPYRQIGPMRIDVIDKIDLPRTVPVFQLLFAGYGAGHIAQHFKMNQLVHTMLGGKSIRMRIAVLIHALHQIGRDADINRAIMLARQHIDARLLFFSHRLVDALKWTLKQVQSDGIFALAAPSQRHFNKQRHPEFISGSIYQLKSAALAEERHS